MSRGITSPFQSPEKASPGLGVMCVGVYPVPGGSLENVFKFPFCCQGRALPAGSFVANAICHLPPATGGETRS